MIPQHAWGPVTNGDRTTFRLWAPGVDALTLVLGGRDLAMEAAGDGWFTATAEAGDGAAYAFRLPDGLTVPDPAARAQVGDVHGASRVVVSDHDWRHDAPETPWEAAVIYECHIGTFTSEGTYRAAIDRLPHLARLGVTAIELLPVAQFGGDRGWGYDGVLPYAPHPAYGTPDDLRALVDAAHGHGLKVLLDVVYNHFGPDGNYLNAYAPDFFDPDRQTPWGAAIDYAMPQVRRFFIDNALYWLDEFRFDGLRFDAIDQIRDPSEPELLVEMAHAIRARHPDAWLTTEDNRNVVHLHRPDAAGRRMDGEWNDDMHNAAHVVLTGETEGYYDTYADDPVGLLARALAHGFATGGAGGEGVDSSDQPPAAFIDFLQNHDQTGNRAQGDRLTTLANADALAAMQAILLLSPHIPMIFMGDEWAETNPFLFFAGFEGDLGRAVTEGRRKEFAGFASHSGDDVPDPIDPATFRASRIDWAKLDTSEGRQAFDRMRDLLTLRRKRIVPLLAGTGPGCGTILDAPEGCIAVDWRLNGATLHLRANMGAAPATVPDAPGDRLHLTGARVGAPRSAAFWLST
ncbi:malto-oligosyltrehalose trehalohydrolase [Jannaschia rubra]|uniref:Malto-oligosyltrehalose trehalohydrolase n=1 Tax=Jannaschia rubra TaxID=282197 RepID=A0A0M6XSM9_9RHOB|nr:malto-oligosyltrehalose trehalohydrolase [Jannaschia rubra]CTQ33054.1 Malto-oligosyltrehalose trehalohydrolase [Jannaschia rubra]SFG75098.1 maltooligosyl trehalose hydrolase [Jannaschia rubra]